jgi:D-inositol-3-phosphate glycosyltransferase
MFSLNNPHVALISVHGDPAIEIGKEEAGGHLAGTNPPS